MFGHTLLAGVPVLDPKRCVIGIEIFAVSEPLKDLFTDDLKSKFLEAMQESMVGILAKISESADEPQADDDIARIDLPKPIRPVINLTSAEMDGYFSALKSAIAKKDGVTIKRKWAKILDDKLLEPTPIPSFDGFVESVLPSSQYFGARTKFAAGNLLWRLQLVCAYLLERNGFDFNTYAHNIPENYVAKNWNVEALIAMGRDPKSTAKSNAAKRK